MSEFSRRVNVEIIKDEPTPRGEFLPNSYLCEKTIDEEYARYLDRFQPYRWHARSHGNGKIVAHGESYFNEADCIENIELNYGDDTTIYRMPMYGEERGETLLRFGATDRASQQP